MLLLKTYKSSLTWQVDKAFSGWNESDLEPSSDEETHNKKLS